VKQIFGALLLGHCLYVVPEAARLDGPGLVAFYEKHQIDISDGTPAHIRLLAESAGEDVNGITVKHFVIGGEALPKKVVEDFFNKWGNKQGRIPKVTNVYGPTECSVDSTYYDVTREKINSLGQIPIGRPMPNYRVYIVSNMGKGIQFRLQPLGAAGELCIGGAGVAVGYLNRPELTAEKFVEFSLIIHPSSRLYKTGDLVRRLPDGNIEYLGRMDHQVKIRCFRIELGEIESHLRKHEKIKEAVVIERVEKDKTGDKYLCAYVIPYPSHSIDEPELREYLALQLPGYMIPTFFIQLEKIPLTPNGKINKSALPDPAFAPGETYLAPVSQLEQELVEIWVEVLEIDKEVIGVNSSFFELGGNSLKTAIMVPKILQKTKVKIPIVEAFKRPTIRQLAEYIANETVLSYNIKSPNLVLIQKKGGSDKNLFFIHDGSGEVDGYNDFCHYLGSDFNYWGIKSGEFENHFPQNLSIEDIAGKYIEEMKSLQQQGPYYIAGWSLGGTIAFEMVRQLEQMKEEIKFFGMIDVMPPDKGLSNNPGEFNLESELNWVKYHLHDIELNRELKKFTGPRHLWPFIVDYLETTNFDKEILKKIIKEDEKLILPDKMELSTNDLIKYLNAGRTFSRAKKMYHPAAKINTPVHFFKASQSKKRIEKKWKTYCNKSINYFKIPGNHLSMMKMPLVRGFSRLFDEVLNEIG